MHSWRTGASPSGTLADVLPSSRHQLSELLSKMLVGRRPDRDTPCAFRNVVKNCSLPGFRRCPQEAGEARRIGHRHRAAPQVGTFRVKARGLGVPPLLGAALGPVAQHALALVALATLARPASGRGPVDKPPWLRQRPLFGAFACRVCPAVFLPDIAGFATTGLPFASAFSPWARVRPRSTQQRAGQNWNTAPLGVFPATHNRPSWASMIERQIDRPIPMPSDFVVNSGLKIRSTSCVAMPLPLSATVTMMSLPITSDLTDRIRGSSSDAIEIDRIRDQIQQHLLQLDSIPCYLSHLPVRVGLLRYPVLL